MESYDVTFVRVARQFEDSCRLAGENELADKVRPSESRPGETQQVPSEAEVPESLEGVDRAPDVSGDLSEIDPPVLRSDRPVVFTATLREAGFLVGRAVLEVDAAGNLLEVARTGEAAPDGNGNIRALQDPLLVSRSGRVAFQVHFENTSGSLDGVGIMAVDPGGSRSLIVRGEDTPPGAPGFVVSHADPAASTPAARWSSSPGCRTGPKPCSAATAAPAAS